MTAADWFYLVVVVVGCGFIIWFVVFNGQEVMEELSIARQHRRYAKRRKEAKE